MINPHRITFISNGNCDVCNAYSDNLMDIKTDKYYGWQHCNSEQCKDTLNNWYNQMVIPIKNLIDKYGEHINIARGNGDIEDDWSFLSDAYQEEKDGDFWVKIFKNHNNKKYVKLITLEDII